MPDASVRRMAEGLQLGRWNARFGLYGREAMTAARLAIVREAVAGIPGAEVVARQYPGDAPASQVHPADHAQMGIPGLALLRMAEWRGGTPAHSDFSLVCPATAVDAQRQQALVQGEVEAAGFDYAGGSSPCAAGTPSRSRSSRSIARTRRCGHARKPCSSASSTAPPPPATRPIARTSP